MFEFIARHQFWVAVVFYWIYSAAVSSMPEPRPDGSPRYLWFYRFCHTMAGNLTTALGSRIAGLKIFGLVLIFPLLFSSTACAAHYVIHPGALNRTDSVAYDTLLIAETTIDQARLDFAAGRFPVEAKDALNRLIRSYNIARDSWLTYRGAVGTRVPSEIYFDQMSKHLTDLTAAIRALQEAK